MKLDFLKSDHDCVAPFEVHFSKSKNLNFNNNLWKSRETLICDDFKRHHKVVEWSEFKKPSIAQKLSIRFFQHSTQNYFLTSSFWWIGGTRGVFFAPLAAAKLPPHSPCPLAWRTKTKNKIRNLMRKWLVLVVLVVVLWPHSAKFWKFPGGDIDSVRFLKIPYRGFPGGDRFCTIFENSL